MRLQAQIRISRKKDKPWLVELHRHVGCAHSLAEVLEEIMVDAHPDLQAKAQAALAFYRREGDDKGVEKSGSRNAARRKVSDG